MRLFVAVELPDAVHEAIGHGLGALRRDLPPSRWVRREGCVTLKFLGEQDEVCEALAGRLAPQLAALAPVSVSLGGRLLPTRAAAARRLAGQPGGEPRDLGRGGESVSASRAGENVHVLPPHHAGPDRAAVGLTRGGDFLHAVEQWQLRHSNAREW
jgi:hypothetical protein